jgi:hypothetical protein
VKYLLGGFCSNIYSPFDIIWAIDKVSSSGKWFPFLLETYFLLYKLFDRANTLRKLYLLGILLLGISYQNHIGMNNYERLNFSKHTIRW